MTLNPTALTPARLDDAMTRLVAKSLEQPDEGTGSAEGLPTPATKDAASDKAAQQARSKQYGIGVKKGGNVTKPAQFKNVPDAKWGDPVNWKLPMGDKAHAKNAASRLAQDAFRKAYTADELTTIEARVTKVKKSFGIGDDDAAEKDFGDLMFRVATTQIEAKGTLVEVDPANDLYDAIPSQKMWGDWANLDFPCRTAEEAVASLKHLADVVGTEPGRYTAEEIGRIAKTLQAPAAAGFTRTRYREKDVGEEFANALDRALDQAILSVFDQVYYAFIRTICGGVYSWDPSWDPDMLSRDEFNGACDLLAEAMKMIYDKLADDEAGDGESVGKALARTAAGSLALLEKVSIEKAMDEVSSMVLETKAGKRHSKADTHRMEIMHGALLGMGYNGCQPSDDEKTEGESDVDDTASSKGLAALLQDAAERETIIKSLGLTPEQVKKLDEQAAAAQPPVTKEAFEASSAIIRKALADQGKVPTWDEVFADLAKKNGASPATPESGAAAPTSEADADPVALKAQVDELTRQLKEAKGDSTNNGQAPDPEKTASTTPPAAGQQATGAPLQTKSVGDPLSQNGTAEPGVKPKPFSMGGPTPSVVKTLPISD